MKILITGGAGFLGLHLAETLKQRNHDVLLLDDFSTSQSDNPRLAAFLGRIITVSVQSPAFFKQVFRADRIYNLASPASPKYYQKEPQYTLDTNYLGLKNVLNNAMHYGTRVLQASTSEVYGDPRTQPQRETDFGNVNSYGPRACYDEGKRVAEALMWSYRTKYGVDTRIARIFNTYGPGMTEEDGRLVPGALWAAMRGRPPRIYGSGEATRSLCYVTDMVEGLIALMEYEGPGCHDPMNLGNPSEHHTVKYVVNRCIRQASLRGLILPEVTPIYETKMQDDPQHRKPDITRAQTLLGWTPSTRLDRGLTLTADWIDEQLYANRKQ